MDGVKSGEAEKDKILALQRLAKDWSSYDLTIYTDGSVTNGTAIGAGGISVTAGHLSNPTIQYSYDIPESTWCSSLQAEMKAIKKGIADYPDKRVTPENQNSQRQRISPATYRKPPTRNTT